MTDLGGRGGSVSVTPPTLKMEPTILLTEKANNNEEVFCFLTIRS